MKVLAAVIIAVFTAQTAAAQRREHRLFNTVNGRTVSDRSVASADAGASRGHVLTTSGSAPLSNGFGDGIPSPYRSGTRPPRYGSVRRGGKAFRSGGRRVDAANPPPNFNKPGALIRTEGQAPKYGNPEPERYFAVYAGEIALNQRRAQDVGRAPSLQQGPKDALPPPNPVSGAAGGAAPNSTTVINNGGNSNSGAQNNTNGNQDGSNGKNPFADPTGFNDAF